MNNNQRAALESLLIDAIHVRMYESYDMRFEAITDGRIGIWEMNDPTLLEMAADYDIDAAPFESDELSDTHNELVKVVSAADQIAALRCALIRTTEQLSAWVEIADDEDERDDDKLALDMAHNALALSADHA